MMMSSPYASCISSNLWEKDDNKKMLGKIGSQGMGLLKIKSPIFLAYLKVYIMKASPKIQNIFLKYFKAFFKLRFISALMFLHGWKKLNFNYPEKFLWKLLKTSFVNPSPFTPNFLPYFTWVTHKKISHFIKIHITHNFLYAFTPELFLRNFLDIFLSFSFIKHTWNASIWKWSDVM